MSENILSAWWFGPPSNLCFPRYNPFWKLHKAFERVLVYWIYFSPKPQKRRRYMPVSFSSSHDFTMTSFVSTPNFSLWERAALTAPWKHYGGLLRFRICYILIVPITLTCRLAGGTSGDAGLFLWVERRTITMPDGSGFLFFLAILLLYYIQILTFKFRVTLFCSPQTFSTCPFIRYL